jgi:hypothetical protein
MPSQPSEVSRNIHFFRADCGTDDDGSPIAFAPRRMLEHINGLSFTSGGRYFEDGENTYCLWVDGVAPPVHLRFAVIRREGLPFVEENGILSALQIPDAAGLVEQIHVEFFQHNIVGCDFNFYGPRLPRLRTYLRERGGPDHQEVAFEPLVRRDILEALDRFGGIRVFDFRVRRADIDLIAQTDRSLGDALRAQAALADAEEVEVILRPKPYARKADLGSGAFQLVRKLVRRGEVLEVARAFRVEGRIDGAPSEPLNILDARLVSEQLIAKEPGRGRSLNRDSAYNAIRTAERQLRDALRAAASIASASPDGA